jgi:hypothetical protein
VLWLLNTVLEQLDATTQLRLDETREIMPAFGWLNCFKLEEFPRLDGWSPSFRNRPNLMSPVGSMILQITWVSVFLPL